ncbi:MAG: helix-turn-helix domain-containing protein [Oscillospiraceae bacterium]|nr:helix-turn-helix domain-containing protein [Oscillospiraceae bacterium]
MKIGVIGPETTVEIIKKVVERDIPDVQIAYCCTEFYEESGALAETLQKRRDIDAILFSGPTNYAYALHRVFPSIPWTYLPHSRTAALRAFLEAIAIHGSDLSAISVDRYDPKFLEETLDIAGIRGAKFYQAPYSPEEIAFEKKLQDFHRDCYRRGLVNICFTSMEHIREPLLAEGIPCVRTFPAEETIREQIYHLQIQDFVSQENQGKLAIIAIRFDYIFDDEKDLFIREWEKMQYQNEFKEKIYAVAQRMEAAVFENSMDQFSIVTTRSMLMNGFLKTGEHGNLMQFGQRGPAYKVWVGMGVGNTMLEAKSRSAMAINHAIADRSGSSYLVEDENRVTASIGFGSIEDRSLAYFARRIGASPATLERLRQVLRDGDTMTSEELAARLGITARSANRIIARLEDAGCITTVGKRSAGKGRPARVIKITLPARLAQA